MPAFNPEEFQQLVDALKQYGFEVRRSARGDEAQQKKTLLEEKFFRRLDKFGGEESKWNEWFFNFRVCLIGVHQTAAKFAEEVVATAAGPVTVETIDLVVPREVKMLVSAELYGILCGLTSGEANVVVRSMVDKGLGYCGFAAIHALAVQFNPRTPTRILQYLGGVINPPALKDIRLLPRATEDWEAKKGKQRPSSRRTCRRSSRSRSWSACCRRSYRMSCFR